MQVHRSLKYSFDLIRSTSAFVVFVIGLIGLRVPCQMASVLVDTLADFGIGGLRREGYAGVWLDDRRKIASIGVGVRRWITLHGFALNVSCDLERFRVIVPCGLSGVEMTSMSRELARPVALDAVSERVALHLDKAFP